MQTTIETIPTLWDDARGGEFFQVTASPFSPAFCYDASVLLACYDRAEVPGEPTVPVPWDDLSASAVTTTAPAATPVGRPRCAP